MKDCHKHHTPAGSSGHGDHAAPAVDPVCGMQVSPATALRHDHGGSAHFFAVRVAGRPSRQAPNGI